MINAPLTRAIALGAVLITSLSTGAFAHDVPGIQDGVDEADAKRIASQYLRSLGYTRPRTSMLTQRVLDAERIGETWRVNVRVGGGTIPISKGIVLVDAETGHILDAIRS